MLALIFGFVTCKGNRFATIVGGSEPSTVCTVTSDIHHKQQRELDRDLDFAYRLGNNV